MSFISRLRRSRQHRVSILSAYLVHPFPLRGTSPRWEACHWIRGSRGSPMNPVPLPPQGETRALRDLLSVSYGKITILLTGSLRSPPPIRLRRTFHLKVKRLTMICASLALLQIMFAVHPRESVSHDSQVALLPYSTAITDSQYFARHCVPSKYVRWCDSCSLATPSGGQNKSLYAFLQRHGSIAKHP